MYTKFELGDDFSKNLFRDDFSGEIVPKQFWDDFSWGRFLLTPWTISKANVERSKDRSKFLLQKLKVVRG